MLPHETYLRSRPCGFRYKILTILVKHLFMTPNGKVRSYMPYCFRQWNCFSFGSQGNYSSKWMIKLEKKPIKLTLLPWFIQFDQVIQEKLKGYMLMANNKQQMTESKQWPQGKHISSALRTYCSCELQYSQHCIQLTKAVI